MKTGQRITVRAGIGLLQGEVIEVTMINGIEFLRLDVAPSKLFSMEEVVDED